MSQRRAHDERERLARRAAGGDLEAARRLVALLEARAGLPPSVPPPEVMRLVGDALMAGTQKVLGPHLSHQERRAVRLAAAALGAMMDFSADVKALRRGAEPENCRFCGELILFGPASRRWLTEREASRECRVSATGHEPALLTMCALCDHFVEENDAWGPGLARYVHCDDGEQVFDHDAEPGESRTSVDWTLDRPELFEKFQDGKIGPNSDFFPNRRGKVR